MKYFVTILAVLGASLSHAQIGTPGIAGAAGAGAGDASVAYTNINSIIGNQAGLAFMDKWGATAFYESRFGLPELSSIGAAAAIPLAKTGVFGLVVNSFGSANAYAEQKIGLSYARKLSAGLSIGGQIDYVALTIPQYGNKGAVTFELGLLAQVMPKLKVGAHVYSPIRQRINETEYIPAVFSAGATYEPNKKSIISAEYEQDMRNLPVIKAGIDYRIANALSLRLGVGSYGVNNTVGVGAVRVSGGIGIHIQKIIIDIAAQYHNQLGYSPSLGLRWQ
jgi:hypothetical protein